MGSKKATQPTLYWDFIEREKYLQCYNTVNVFESSFPKLLKLIKYPKFPIFSGLENNGVTFFIYNVITLLMKWGHNKLQTQQQKYLHCYNNVNIFVGRKKTTRETFWKGC